jgi:hypothetical protein
MPCGNTSKDGGVGMILYHGSDKKFGKFRQKGKDGEFSLNGRKAVWFGEDKEKIRRKYGKQGFLYTVEVPDEWAIPYREQIVKDGRKMKKPHLTSGIFVAPAWAVEIVSVERI